MIVTASIVLYNNQFEDICILVTALANNASIDYLFLIDNSELNLLEKNFVDPKINYIHNPSNPGFGAGHNIAINNSIELNSSFHFIINPDIYFESEVIESMLYFITSDDEIGMLMPKILNLDGTIQFLPKLLPSPYSIILRKMKWPKFQYLKFIENYELRNISQNLIYNTPILSGCFTLLNIKAIKDVGMYDDDFFMYFEDWDLSRRIHVKYKTIYFPRVAVFHGYDSGANKNIFLLKIFFISFIRYFNKWGWFFDEQRFKLNSTTLRQFEVHS